MQHYNSAFFKKLIVLGIIGIIIFLVISLPKNQNTEVKTEPQSITIPKQLSEIDRTQTASEQECKEVIQALSEKLEKERYYFESDEYLKTKPEKNLKFENGQWYMEKNEIVDVDSSAFDSYANLKRIDMDNDGIDEIIDVQTVSSLNLSSTTFYKKNSKGKYIALNHPTYNELFVSKLDMGEFACTASFFRCKNKNYLVGVSLGTSGTNQYSIWEVNAGKNNHLPEHLSSEQEKKYRNPLEKIGNIEVSNNGYEIVELNKSTRSNVLKNFIQSKDPMNADSWTNIQYDRTPPPAVKRLESGLDVKNITFNYCTVDFNNDGKLDCVGISDGNNRDSFSRFYHYDFVFYENLGHDYTIYDTNLGETQPRIPEIAQMNLSDHFYPNDRIEFASYNNKHYLILIKYSPQSSNPNTPDYWTLTAYDLTNGKVAVKESIRFKYGHKVSYEFKADLNVQFIIDCIKFKGTSHKSAGV